MAWDPDDRPFVVDHRHAGIGVHGAEMRGVEPAELAAGVDPLVRDAELSDGPHRLVDIDRV
jgi:hypothetical protein